jgi:hypothetical protein
MCKHCCVLESRHLQLSLSPYPQHKTKRMLIGTPHLNVLLSLCVFVMQGIC